MVWEDGKHPKLSDRRYGKDDKVIGIDRQRPLWEDKFRILCEDGMEIIAQSERHLYTTF
jgi:hypothetical protein